MSDDDSRFIWIQFSENDGVGCARLMVVKIYVYRDGACEKHGAFRKMLARGVQ